jgi:ferredoxin
MTADQISAGPLGYNHPHPAAAASGEVPLRRPRDGRRANRARNGATGAIPIGGGPEVSTTAIPLRGTGRRTSPLGGEQANAAPQELDQNGSVPKARPTGTPPAGLTGPIKLLLGPMTGSLRLPGLSRNDPTAEQRMRVDWPQCKAHGLCAEIAPEIIHLDEWGYPVFDPGAVDPADLLTAKKAVQVCPTLALRLVDIPPKS